MHGSSRPALHSGPTRRRSPLVAWGRRAIWTDEEVAATGWELADAQFVTVGGGLGSFALVDLLRVAGMAATDIRVVTTLSHPSETFAALCHASQLFDADRLRSDSMSRLDNVWGWPGYAFSEARVERTLRPVWRVLTEPLLAEYFTPRVRTIVAGLDREAERIGWKSMLEPGWASLVRRRAGGGYFVVVPSTGGGVPTRVLRARDVHLALGHAGPRRLPDLEAHRQAHGTDARMVHAYDPHDHVYEMLVSHPGRVLVRGSGIAASRVIERLADDRVRRGADTEIVHLFRTYIDAPRGPRRFRRPGGNGFAYQEFTFPKAAGAGQLSQWVRSSEGEDRAELIRSMGGTTTPARRSWTRQIAAGRSQGWYRALEGDLAEVAAVPDGLRTTLRSTDGRSEEIAVDWVIDATGLESNIRSHALIADLLDTGLTSTNPLGRLDVSPTFQVRGAASDPGALYASGAAALGGYLAPVDSFWGLSHAAIEICDDLAGRGNVTRIDALRSMAQWVRWILGRQP